MKRKTVADGIGSGSTLRSGAAAKADLGVNSEIGRKLKRYYDDLLSDQVPDRFADLLSQLEKAESSGKKD